MKNKIKKKHLIFSILINLRVEAKIEKKKNIDLDF
jgi:hypothetical protein